MASRNRNRNRNRTNNRPRPADGLRGGIGRPLAIGAGGTAAIVAVGYAGPRILDSEARRLEAKAALENPDIQTGVVDPNPGVQGDEFAFIFDPRTGSTLTSGADVTRQTDADRSDERQNKNFNLGVGSSREAAVLAAGVAAVALVVVLANRGGK